MGRRARHPRRRHHGDVHPAHAGAGVLRPVQREVGGLKDMRLERAVAAVAAHRVHAVHGPLADAVRRPHRRERAVPAGDNVVNDLNFDCTAGSRSTSSSLGGRADHASTCSCRPVVARLGRLEQGGARYIARRRGADRALVSLIWVDDTTNFAGLIDIDDYTTFFRVFFWRRRVRLPGVGTVREGPPAAPRRVLRLHPARRSWAPTAWRRRASC